MKKIAVIFFHKNIYNLYNEYWIDKCIQSVLDQSYKNFDIFEINYGNEDKSIFHNKNIKNHGHNFFIKNYNTHTEAMLFLLSKCFDEYKYDIVFNTNLDDYYHINRFEEQIKNLEEGNVLNSTMWTYIEQKDKDIKEDDICLTTHCNTFFCKNDNFICKKYNNLNDIQYNAENVNYELIKKELFNKNNILNHSGICFTKIFWNSKDKYGNFLRYRRDKPFEDLSLWYRALENNIPISIVNKNLIYYRIHSNQIGEKQKKSKKEKKFTLDFCKEPNLSPFELGILSIINTEKDFINIIKIENKIIPDIKKFYFIFVKDELQKDIIKYLEEHNIYKYEIFNISNEVIIKNDFDFYNLVENIGIKLEMNSDYILYLNNFNFENNITSIKEIKELKTNSEQNQIEKSLLDVKLDKIFYKNKTIRNFVKIN
jgi:hypothetical protein